MHSFFRAQALQYTHLKYPGPVVLGSQQHPVVGWFLHQLSGVGLCQSIWWCTFLWTSVLNTLECGFPAISIDISLQQLLFCSVYHLVPSPTGPDSQLRVGLPGQPLLFQVVGAAPLHLLLLHSLEFSLLTSQYLDNPIPCYSWKLFILNFPCLNYHMACLFWLFPER